jgi:hypothetical protein
MITGRKKIHENFLYFSFLQKIDQCLCGFATSEKSREKLSFRNRSTVIVSQQRERASYLILCPIDKLPTEARPVKVLFKNSKSPSASLPIFETSPEKPIYFI